MSVRSKKRNANLKLRYGITLEQFDCVSKHQNHACLLCFYKNKKYALHVDHCHRTGRIRGLLCMRCNLFLATVERVPKVLKRIREYLGDEYEW